VAIRKLRSGCPKILSFLYPRLRAIAFLSLSLVLLNKRSGLAAKNRNVCFNNCPYQSIIDGGIFVGQLVAEVNDAARSSNCLKNGWCDARECSYGLADENELSLDG
jgi:hypothetical protein